MINKQIPKGYTQNDVKALKDAEKVMIVARKIVKPVCYATGAAWLSFIVSSMAKWENAAQNSLALGVLIPLTAVVGALVVANDWKKRKVVTMWGDPEIVKYAQDEFVYEQNKKLLKKKERHFRKSK